MLRAAEGSWFSGTFLHPVMLRSPASRTAFAGVSRGSLGPHADSDEDTLRHGELLLAELYRSSVSGRIATGPRPGSNLKYPLTKPMPGRYLCDRPDLLKELSVQLPQLKAKYQ